MSLPITDIVFNSDISWTFLWEAVPGVTRYRVVLWGQELAVVSTTSYRFTDLSFTIYPPPLEVIPAGEQALSEQNPPFWTIQWYRDECDHYVVNEDDDPFMTVQQDQTSWVYSYTSPVLLDQTTYNYGVRAVDAVGNVSDEQEYEHYIVCPPKPPDGTLDYDYAAGVLMVSTL